jgi:hypothetical protein
MGVHPYGFIASRFIDPVFPLLCLCLLEVVFTINTALGWNCRLANSDHCQQEANSAADDELNSSKLFLLES